MMTQADLPNLTAVLNEMAAEFQKLYKGNLDAHKRPASGELERAIASTRVVVNGSVYEVSVELPYYWKYVDTGTRGRLPCPWRKLPAPNEVLPGRKFPPLPKILNWVNIKGLPIPAGLTPERFAAQIAGKIMWYGTEGTNDFADARREVIEQFRDRITEALGHDAEYYIIKYVNETTA